MLNESLKSSHLIKIAVMAVLVLILQFPIVQIKNLISQRWATRNQAKNEVARLVGETQILRGPFIRQPKAPSPAQETNKGAAEFIFPDKMEVQAQSEIQLRHKGLFEFPTHQTKIRIRAIFANKEVLEENPNPELMLGISNTLSLGEEPKVSWDGESIEPKTIPDSAFLGSNGLQASLPKKALAGPQTHELIIDISLSGAEGLRFVPLAARSDFLIKSPWPHPSFAGAFAPFNSEINAQGFSASWRFSDMSIAKEALRMKRPQLLQAYEFGVDFIQPVDSYRMAVRTISYQLLFVFLTFLCFFMCELSCKLCLHPVQYLMVGAALNLFYLLPLSLSEHLGFDLAYALSYLLTLGLIAGYSKALLGRKIALGISSMLSALYGFLYVVLKREDFALLLGALGLFVILAVIMYATRKIDWYAIGRTATNEDSVS